ncbi:hypothetical protein [Pseudogemmobacter bohemicus]|uniref:hypothetical protein n=1 Tax=Pseudogemmobacter bohemicus TaxID=2250708 RepID=UPI00130041A1|nr:hypothetical protein [Pseudogemmobacter bohemicus]
MPMTATGRQGAETWIGEVRTLRYGSPRPARDAMKKFSCEICGDQGGLTERTGAHGTVTGSGAAAKTSCAGRASWSAGSRSRVSF